MPRPYSHKLIGRIIMKNVQRDDLLKNTGNSIYKLVVLASRRALELNNGMPKMIEESPGKSGSIALEEIKQGKVKLK